MMRLVVLKKGLVAGHYRTIHGKRTFVSPYSDRRMRHTGPLDPKQATLFGGEADEAQGKLFGGPVAEAAQKQAQALIDAHGGDVGEAQRHHKENAQVAHHLGEQKPEDVATHVATAAALKEKGEGGKPPEKAAPFQLPPLENGSLEVLDRTIARKARESWLMEMQARSGSISPHAARFLSARTDASYWLDADDVWGDFKAFSEKPAAAPATPFAPEPAAPSTPPPSNVVSLADARARRDAMASAQSAEAEKMGAPKAAYAGNPTDEPGRPSSDRYVTVPKNQKSRIDAIFNHPGAAGYGIEDHHEKAGRGPVPLSAIRRELETNSDAKLTDRGNGVYTILTGNPRRSFYVSHPVGAGLAPSPRPDETPLEQTAAAPIADKLEAFRAHLEASVHAELARHYPKLVEMGSRGIARIKVGKKYANVDVGDGPHSMSGKYMVDLSTGEIFGIKAYGVPNKGHRYGTLDTLGDFHWGGFRADRKK